LPLIVEYKLQFTVESIETESVGVQWQCRALGDAPGSGPPVQPRFLVEGEDLKRLKLLNLFEPCTLQVGARNFLILTENDTFVTKSQWKKTQSMFTVDSFIFLCDDSY
jgi:ubiquitin-conjugating enzyme E2 O